MTNLEEVLRTATNPEPAASEDAAEYELTSEHATVLAKCAIELVGVDEEGRRRILDALHAFALPVPPDRVKEAAMLLLGAFGPYLSKYLEHTFSAATAEPPRGSWGEVSAMPPVPSPPLANQEKYARVGGGTLVYVENGRLMAVVDEDGLPFEVPAEVFGAFTPPAAVPAAE